MNKQREKEQKERAKYEAQSIAMMEAGNDRFIEELEAKVSTLKDVRLYEGIIAFLSVPFCRGLGIDSPQLLETERME